MNQIPLEKSSLCVGIRTNSSIRVHIKYIRLYVQCLTKYTSKYEPTNA